MCVGQFDSSAGPTLQQGPVNRRVVARCRLAKRSGAALRRCLCLERRSAALGASAALAPLRCMQTSSAAGQAGRCGASGGVHGGVDWGAEVPAQRAVAGRGGGVEVQRRGAGAVITVIAGHGLTERSGAVGGAGDRWWRLKEALAVVIV